MVILDPWNQDGDAYNAKTWDIKMSVHKAVGDVMDHFLSLLEASGSKLY